MLKPWLPFHGARRDCDLRTAERQITAGAFAHGWPLGRASGVAWAAVLATLSSPGQTRGRGDRIAHWRDAVGVASVRLSPGMVHSRASSWALWGAPPLGRLATLVGIHADALAGSSGFLDAQLALKGPPSALWVRFRVVEDANVAHRWSLSTWGALAEFPLPPPRSARAPSHRLGVCRRSARPREAEWLAFNDRFDDALDAYKKAKRPDLSLEMIEKLTCARPQGREGACPALEDPFVSENVLDRV